MTKTISLALAAAALLLLPTEVWACPNCISGPSSPAVRAAYLAVTALLSAIPLVGMCAIAWLLVRSDQPEPGGIHFEEGSFDDLHSD